MILDYNLIFINLPNEGIAAATYKKSEDSH
jgi:hypothetical protein